MSSRGGYVGRDGCAVDGAAIAGLIGTYVQAWTRKRPVDTRAGRTSAAARKKVDPALVALSARLAEPPIGHPIKPRQLERLAAHRTPLVQLRDADALVAALGCPEAFHDGTLEIVVNPAARRENRLSCCGGSDGADQADGGSLTGVA